MLQQSQELISELGSPLFVYSARKICQNLESFRQQFQNLYADATVAYSLKVNALPAIVDLLHQQGAWAEVASGCEYRLARRLGVSGSQIIFNGPYKTIPELETAIEDGAWINVDHWDELNNLQEITIRLGKKVDIGLRLNTHVGIDQLPDRFGFNLESGDAERAVRAVTKSRFLNIKGLHVHLTSYIVESRKEGEIPAHGIKLIWPKDSDAYKRAANAIVGFAKAVQQRQGVKIEKLNLGGGFPAIDELGPYTEAVVTPILESFSRDERPKLFLEPGRALVGDAAHLLTTVVAVKNLPNGQTAVVADAGINALPTSTFRYQDIECLTHTSGEERDTVVYGPLCLQTDIIARAMLPDLKPGDILKVDNVGAYNEPLSSNFIFERPAVIMIDGDQKKVIRALGV